MKKFFIFYLLALFTTQLFAKGRVSISLKNTPSQDAEVYLLEGNERKEFLGTTPLTIHKAQKLEGKSLMISKKNYSSFQIFMPQKIDNLLSLKVDLKPISESYSEALKLALESEVTKNAEKLVDQLMALQLQINLGNLDKAALMIEKLERNYPNSRSLKIAKANLMISKGNVSKAELIYRQVLDSTPQEHKSIREMITTFLDLKLGQSQAHLDKQNNKMRNN